jgi:hypothetical protein
MYYPSESEVMKILTGQMTIKGNQELIFPKKISILMDYSDNYSNIHERTGIKRVNGKVFMYHKGIFSQLLKIKKESLQRNLRTYNFQKNSKILKRLNLEKLQGGWMYSILESTNFKRNKNLQSHIQPNQQRLNNFTFCFGISSLTIPPVQLEEPVQLIDVNLDFSENLFEFL